MEKDAALAKLKCVIAYDFKDDIIRREYMINLCNGDDEDVMDDIMKNSLLIDLIENESLLNYTDSCGKKVINCDLTKIKEI